MSLYSKVTQGCEEACTTRLVGSNSAFTPQIIEERKGHQHGVLHAATNVGGRSARGLAAAAN